MKKVEISAAALKTLVDAYKGSDKVSKNLAYFSMTPEVVSAFEEIERVASYVYPMGGEMKEGYFVIPKVGQNYLRAGQKAYGEAVVVSTNPFSVITTNGIDVWVNLPEENFVVRDKVPDELFQKLMKDFKRINYV